MFPDHCASMTSGGQFIIDTLNNEGCNREASKDGDRVVRSIRLCERRHGCREGSAKLDEHCIELWSLRNIIEGPVNAAVSISELCLRPSGISIDELDSKVA